MEWRFSRLLLVIILFATQSTAHEGPGIELRVASWLGAGFFAELKNVMGSIIECDAKNLQRIVVDWTQEFFPYKDDLRGNGWDLYFDIIKATAPADPSFVRVGNSGAHVLHDQTCMERWVRYDSYLFYREFVHKKFNEYIKIKRSILDEVDQFYTAYMQHRFCIGVHVRFAAAHAAENPGNRPIPLGDYIREARMLMQAHHTENPVIFLLSDSNHVINEFKHHFNPGQLVYTNAPRAHYNEEPHLIYENANYYLAHPHEFHARKPGFRGGKMTLIDCLLLARCNVMVHSHSNVCEFASFFNPQLRSVFLPKGFSARPCAYAQAPLHVYKIIKAFSGMTF